MFAPGGGQGSRALSLPILLESPAARITAQKLDARLIKGR